MRRLDKPEAEARDIVISEEENATSLEVVKEPNFHDLIVAAWATGARPRELLIVEARHVQLEQARWVFPKKQAKGKKRMKQFGKVEVPQEAFMAVLS